MKRGLLVFLTLMMLLPAAALTAERVTASGSATIGSTAVPLVIPAGTTSISGAVIYVEGTAATDGIRWTCGGTDPTASVGLLAKDGSVITLDSGIDVGSFRAILNSGSGSCTLHYLISSR